MYVCMYGATHTCMCICMYGGKDIGICVNRYVSMYAGSHGSMQVGTGVDM